MSGGRTVAPRGATEADCYSAVMDDREFDQLIDCRFPYGDEKEWKRIVDLGRSISANAHFITLSEISRPPMSARVTRPAQRAMVDYWSGGFEHPLKDAIVQCALAKIERRPLSIAHVLRVMDTVARHRGQWGALVVAIAACDDVDDIADDRFQAIKSEWGRDGV